MFVQVKKIFKKLKHFLFKQELQKVEIAVSISEKKYTVVVIDSRSENKVKQVFSVEAKGSAKILPLLQKEIERQNLKGKRCNLVLPETDYQLFLVERPAVEDKALNAALRWRIADYVTESVNNFSIDYIELPSKSNSTEKKLVYVVAANTQKIKAHKRNIEQCGLLPVNIEIPELALRNIALKLQGVEKGQVLLKFNGDLCQMILIRGNLLLLMRKLVVQKDDATTLQDKIQTIALEIQRTIDYCSSYIMDASHLDIVYIAQDHVYQTMIEGLEKTLGLKAHRIDLEEVFNGNDIQAAELEKGLVALGSVLEGEIDETNY